MRFCFYFIIIARDRSLIKREEETETMKYIYRGETEKTESTAKTKDTFGHTEVYLRAKFDLVMNTDQCSL